MTPAETIYRLAQKARSEVERARTVLAGKPRRGAVRHGRSFLNELREGPALRFYFNPAARLSIFQFLAREFPAWIEAADREADGIASHKITLLGYGEVDLGPEIDWHRDPVTGRKWPTRFWTDYDPVRDCSAGDPKTIHEVNRHTHLPPLAKAYFLTGQERYAREAVSQLLSWVDQNPPSLGINWQSSLEIALRCLSWIWSLFFLLPSRALDEESALRIARSLFTQLEHVSRYPSIYSSPNTHLLGEATALFVSGALFREHRRSSAWLRQGLTLLLEQMKTQVTADGVHAELSTYYHCYTVDLYLQAFVLAQRNGITIPPHAWSTLSRMIDFLQHVAAPDGSIPRLGDDDGGRALTLCSNAYSSFRDAFCSGAVLFGREDFKDRSGGFSEETLWLLGEDAFGVYSRLQPGNSEPGPGEFPDAGYFVQRSGWSARADRLIFDCGGLGKPSGGHGHADALSFTVAVAGRELLVDPGTFIYNTSPEWRQFFRSTGAHNTVVIDSRDQSEPGATFQWRSAARPRILRSVQSPGYVEAEHDGYTRLSEPVVHRRRVLHAGTYWVIADDFRGRGNHRFEMNFHFAPGTNISAGQAHSQSTGLEIVCESGRAGAGLFLCASAPLLSEIVSGQERPLQGWVSRRYGHRESAPVLVARMSASTPASALTCLFPFHAAAGRGTAVLPEVRTLHTEPGVLACELRRGNLRDLLLFAPGRTGEIAISGITAVGDFFWIRTQGDQLARAFGVQARSLTHRGTRLLDTDEPQLIDYSPGEVPVISPETSGGKHTCAEFAES